MLLHHSYLKVRDEPYAVPARSPLSGDTQIDHPCRIQKQGCDSTMRLLSDMVADGARKIIMAKAAHDR